MLDYHQELPTVVRENVVTLTNYVQKRNLNRLFRSIFGLFWIHFMLTCWMKYFMGLIICLLVSIFSFFLDNLEFEINITQCIFWTCCREADVLVTWLLIDCTINVAPAIKVIYRMPTEQITSFENTHSLNYIIKYITCTPENFYPIKLTYSSFFFIDYPLFFFLLLFLICLISVFFRCRRCSILHTLWTIVLTIFKCIFTWCCNHIFQNNRTIFS